MYLLLQSRTDQSGWHEYKCFFEATELPYNQLVQANLLTNELTPKRLRELINESKGIIIGGSAEVTYKEDDSQKRINLNTARNKLLPILKDIIQKDTPQKILGVCFGHQLIAEALNAKVAHKPEQKEVGVETIKLTKEGEKDPLFKDLNTEFQAILGHQDAVLNLPDESVHLAYSKKSPIQAFRYGKLIYGVQFHPELEYEDLQWRLSLAGNETYKESIDNTDKKVIIQTRKIIKNFINL